MSNNSVNGIIAKLSLKEKISLLSGDGFWKSEKLSSIELPRITFSDGPFGLRKITSESKSGVSKAATSFPCSSALASSFDKNLLRKVGEAIGSECVDQDVDVLLGPSINIKRNPLGGRNFEYYSEDPFLSGTLASEFVTGVQSKGVSACLKHFAVASQEEKQMVVNEIVDQRALFETYLEPFRIVLTSENPADVIMTSNNMINNVYATENSFLIKEVLRTNWNYKGLVLSGWGSTNNVINSLHAGVNLLMPGISNDTKIYHKAIKNGIISENEIDEAIKPLIKLMINKRRKIALLPKKTSDLYEQNYLLSVEAAKKSAVLLKNEGNILPTKMENNVLLLGQYARHPRFQGVGSSSINPTKVRSIFTALSSHGVNYRYSKGYNLDNDIIDDKIIEDAVAKASGKNLVIIVVGLPLDKKMEGNDRVNLDLPASHNKLIEEVAKVNDNIVVILSTGSPVLMPWLDKVRGVLQLHLGGGGSGQAAVDLLYGKDSPSGKLAETYPNSLIQTPSYNYYSNRAHNNHHRESIYVGYRFYQKAKQKPLFPFGFGLSYSKFDISNLKFSTDSLAIDESLHLQVTIKNIGQMEAQEVIQVYLGPVKSKQFMPLKSLKAFEKVTLKPGEEKVVSFVIPYQDFGYFDIKSKNYVVEKGNYNVFVGNSSENNAITKRIEIESNFVPNEIISKIDPVYYNLDKSSVPLEISYKAFKSLNNGNDYLTTSTEVGKVTMSSTYSNVKNTITGRIVNKYAKKRVIKGITDPIIRKNIIDSFDDIPFRSYPWFSDNKITANKAQLLVDFQNKNFIKVIIGLFKK